MKYLKFAYIVVVLSAIACKKEKENIITPTLDNSRLTLIHTERGFFTDERFEYDKDGYVIRYTSFANKKGEPPVKQTDIRYERDANHLVRREVFSSTQLNGDVNVTTGEYYYNTDERLQKVVYNTTGQYTLEYLWQNEKTSMIMAYYQATSTFIDTLYRFQYNGDGNVTSVTISPSLTPGESLSPLTHSGYIYDDKPGYHTTIKGLDNVSYFLGRSIQYVCNNNLVANTSLPSDMHQMQYNITGLPAQKKLGNYIASFQYGTQVKNIGVQ